MGCNTPTRRNTIQVYYPDNEGRTTSTKASICRDASYTQCKEGYLLKFLYTVAAHQTIIIFQQKLDGLLWNSELTSREPEWLILLSLTISDLFCSTIIGLAFVVFKVKCLVSNWVDCCWIWFRHSWSPSGGIVIHDSLLCNSIMGRWKKIWEENDHCWKMRKE